MSRENPEYGSQGNEDAVLAALLPEATGTYIDIGAHHPHNCSNTWQFYCRGWRGVLVEPLMESWPDLLQHRMGDLLIPVAISDNNYFGQLRVQGSVSSLEASWPISAIRSVKVPTMTLATLASTVRLTDQTIHLCSIDVEGHERQVLERNDWHRVRPWVFCIEAMTYNPEGDSKDISGEWEHILLDAGYLFVCKTELNRIYIRRDILSKGMFQGSTKQAISASNAGIVESVVEEKPSLDIPATPSWPEVPDK